jgi:hypothetical protein
LGSWSMSVLGGELAHGTAWHAEFWATRRRVGSGLVDDGVDLLSLTTIIIAVAEYPVYPSLCCAIDIKSPYVQQWPCLVMIYVRFEHEEWKQILEAKPWNVVPHIPFSLSRSFSRRVWSWSVLLPRRNTSLLIGRASISDRMMASNMQ